MIKCLRLLTFILLPKFHKAELIDYIQTCLKFCLVNSFILEPINQRFEFVCFACEVWLFLKWKFLPKYQWNVKKTVLSNKLMMLLMFFVVLMLWYCSITVIFYVSFRSSCDHLWTIIASYHSSCMSLVLSRLL